MCSFQVDPDNNVLVFSIQKIEIAWLSSAMQTVLLPSALYVYKYTIQLINLHHPA